MGRQPKPQPKPVVVPKQPEKLHLNIWTKVNNIFKGKSSPSLSRKKGVKEGVSTPVRFREWKDLVYFIVGYGIIGSFVLFLAIMLLPPSQLGLSEVIKGNVWLQLVISIIGTGSLIYLYFDLVIEPVVKQREV